MKIQSLLPFILFSVSNIWAANDCEMFIQVLPPSGVPEDVGNILETRLEAVLAVTGTVAAPDYGQFFLMTKCVDLYKETVEGTPSQVAVHAELTIAVADIEGGTIFATKTFDLRGVGSTEQRAYINSIKSLSARNQSFVNLIDEAKSHTITYFNNNYKSFLKKAEKAASLRDFEQALYYSTLIPTCSTGYNEAIVATKKYYQEYVDEEGAKLLRDAKAAFALSPNAEGAYKAYAILAGISRQSSYYNAAMNFADEIKRQTKAEYDFEVHQKYEDQIDLQRSIINAAREVGVAYGKGQRDHTTNILWK